MSVTRNPIVYGSLSNRYAPFTAEPTPRGDGSGSRRIERWRKSDTLVFGILYAAGEIAPIGLASIAKFHAYIVFKAHTLHAISLSDIANFDLSNATEKLVKIWIEFDRYPAAPQEVKRDISEPDPIKGIPRNRGRWGAISALG